MGRPPTSNFGGTAAHVEYTPFNDLLFNSASNVHYFNSWPKHWSNTIYLKRTAIS